jgi:hypothetical protein
MSTVTMSPIAKPTYRVGPRNGFKNESLIEVPDMHVTDDLLVDGDMEVTGTLYCTLLTSGVTISATNHITADIIVDDLCDITAATGAEIFDYSASTAAFDTGKGTNTLNGNVVIAGSKTFATGTGAVGINGNVTLAATKGITKTAGIGDIDFSAGTGTFLTTSGENTLSGNTTISGTKTFTTGSGDIALNGDVTVATGKDILMVEAGTGTFFTGAGAVHLDVTVGAGKNILMQTTGAFTSGSGAVTLAGDVGIAANKNIVMGTAGSGTGIIQTGTGAISLNGATTIATGKTLAVTDADAFSVGGIIVPQYRILSVPFAAASVNQWAFVADAAYMLDQAEYIYTVAGTAGTIDIKKSTSVQAPASGATMLTGTGSLAGTANTVTALTPHGTGGNKSLADGNTMSICYTGDISNLAGGILTIRLKRI